MKSFSGKNIFSALTLTATLLSTSYAHAAPRFLCVFEEPSEDTRFELDIREEADEGTLTYKYSPIGDTSVVQGKMVLTKTDATWSHFVYTGKDSIATVKASVPAGLSDNSVYLEMDVMVNGRLAEPVKWLNCTRAR